MLLLLLLLCIIIIIVIMIIVTISQVLRPLHVRAGGRGDGGPRPSLLQGEPLVEHYLCPDSKPNVLLPCESEVSAPAEGALYRLDFGTGSHDD